jgi:hypothetical protein
MYVAAAQPAHHEVFATLMADCLSSVTDSLGTYAIVGPERLPFLTATLAKAGLEAGHTVYLADSSDADLSVPALRLTVARAEVSLRRHRRRMDRRVDFAADATVVAGETRRVLDTVACRGSYADTFPRGLARSMASDLSPETRPPLPEARWVRRILEPTVAVGAVVLGTYLFFTLRSERAQDS